MENNTEKLDTKDKLEIAGEIVVDEGINIAIESGLQLIPFVGGALSTAYFSTKQAKQFKRVENFYNQLATELKGIESRIIAIENQYEDGLISLIEQLNNKIENEHQDSKVECYIKYMKNLLTNQVNEFNYDKKKVFLDILDNISLLEIELIVFLYNEKYLAKNNKFTVVENINKNGIDMYAIVAAVSKLKIYGFLTAIQESMSVGGGDNSLKESISITNYGVEFIEFTMK